jgi:hypothetical protein
MLLLPRSTTTATDTIDGESKLAESPGRDRGFDSAALKHLTFTRWLYATGRLTEWEVRWLYASGRLHEG